MVLDRSFRLIIVSVFFLLLDSFRYFFFFIGTIFFLQVDAISVYYWFQAFFVFPIGLVQCNFFFRSFFLLLLVSISVYFQTGLFGCSSAHLEWNTVGKKSIRALEIVLAIFLCFECQFLSFYACYEEYKT